MIPTFPSQVPFATTHEFSRSRTTYYRSRQQPHMSEYIGWVQGDGLEHRRVTSAGGNTRAPAMDQHPEDAGDVSTTNSEVESALNHQRRKGSLHHPAVTDHEINALDSVDMHLGAARLGLEGITNIMRDNLLVSNNFNDRI